MFAFVFISTLANIVVFKVLFQYIFVVLYFESLTGHTGPMGHQSKISDVVSQVNEACTI